MVKVPPDARVVVVVASMIGCPACDDFKPRVEAIAPSYQRFIPVVYLVLDPERPDPAISAWMDEHNVDGMPTSFVLRRHDHLGGGEWRMTGSVPDDQIQQMFDFAYSRLFAR